MCRANALAQGLNEFSGVHEAHTKLYQCGEARIRFPGFRFRVLGDGQEVPEYGIYADKDWHSSFKGQAAMITRLDRYVGDFETLLSEVARTSRDPDAERNYIASDTGKVYTMLAHASGRFD